MKEFTWAELEQARGPDGNPTLVAVNGKVYDTSSSPMWRKGLHVKSHEAGQDLSLEIHAAPHSLDVLDRLEQVGVLAEAAAVSPKAAQVPAIIRTLLRRRPHAIAIHFPIAFGFVASIFMFGYLVLRRESFETVAFYCVLVAALSAPVAISTGLLSWFYNYHAVRTPIYRGKMLLSAVLIVLLVSALVVRLGLVGEANVSSPLYWLYMVLVAAMAPTVVSLGHLGGKILFPS